MAQILTPGEPIPFEFAAATKEENLDVAMEVWEVGSPDVLVDTIPMDHKSNGQYVAMFAPEDGKSYYINKCVYTDNSYTTLHDAYGQGSESFICKDLASGGSGGGGGSCEGEFVKMRVCLNQSVKMLVGQQSIKMKVGC